MRRASLVLLAAAVVVVAGWSSVAARSVHAGATAPHLLVVGSEVGPGPGTADGTDVGTADAVSRGVLIGAAVAPVVLEAGAPIARLVVDRAAAPVLAALALLVGGVLAAVAGPTPTRRVRAARRSGPAPLLEAAPRRGPPVLVARQLAH